MYVDFNFDSKPPTIVCPAYGTPCEFFPFHFDRHRVMQFDRHLAAIEGINLGTVQVVLFVFNLKKKFRWNIGLQVEGKFL